MLTAGIFPLTVFCKNGDITNPELSGGKMPDAGRNMIHIGEEGAQKTDTSNLQGNAQTVVITSAFSDKFLVCFIKVKISCQLKLIRFIDRNLNPKKIKKTPKNGCLFNTACVP